jgi:hypothetical protein
MEFLSIPRVIAGDQPNTSQEKHRKIRKKYIKANKHETNNPIHHRTFPWPIKGQGIAGDQPAAGDTRDPLDVSQDKQNGQNIGQQTGNGKAYIIPRKR